jgi:hypothetical protein
MGGMDTQPFLTDAEYCRVIRAALKAHGIEPDQADELIAARWPLVDPGQILSEASGRGILLSPADLDDFAFVATGGRAEAGAEITVTGPDGIDHLLAWAVTNGRGEPTAAGQVRERAPGLLDALASSEAAPWN